MKRKGRCSSAMQLPRGSSAFVLHMQKSRVSMTWLILLCLKSGSELRYEYIIMKQPINIYKSVLCLLIFIKLEGK